MIPFRSRTGALAGVLAGVVSLCLCASQVSLAQQGQPQGLPNFGQVSDSLYRGAQPTAAAFSALHQMGVSIVVNFRNESDEIASEKRQVEANGMQYVVIPWSARDTPSNRHVAQFLDLVRSNPDAKIFVHCKAGADRTGVMVAAYRIAVEHKAVGEAVGEMHRYHYHAFFLPHLERYVKTLPGLLQTDTAFSAYAPTAPAGRAASPLTAAPAARSDRGSGPGSHRRALAQFRSRCTLGCPTFAAAREIAFHPTISFQG